MPTEKKQAKVSVSSADEPLVEAGSVEVSDGQRKLSLGVLIGSIVISCGTIAIVCTVAVYFTLGRASGERNRQDLMYISLIFNTNDLPPCAAQLKISVLPCLRNGRLMTGRRQFIEGGGDDAFPVGPMTCRDDAYAQSGGSDNCEGNLFKIVDKGTGVKIPESGVYRVRSVITFSDMIDYYVSASIRITPSSCNPSCTSKNSHAWLSCFNYSRPKQNSTSQFSTCTIDGVRRFDRGDILSLQTSQSYRSINPFHKVTSVLIQRL